MSWGTRRNIAEHRRREVAKLRLRGLSVREIEVKLAQDGIVNEKQQKPWSRSVIGKDIVGLEAQWREEALGDITQMKANVLAEIREVLRAAWGADRLDLALRALEDIRKLCGLDAPAKTDMNITAQEPVKFIRVVKPDDAE